RITLGRRRAWTARSARLVGWRVHGTSPVAGRPPTIARTVPSRRARALLPPERDVRVDHRNERTAHHARHRNEERRLRWQQCTEYGQNAGRRECPAGEPVRRTPHGLALQRPRRADTHPPV